MCHSQLMAMLMNPTEFQKAIYSYSATTPQIEYEGVAGYIETVVTFHLRDLEAFTSLYYKSIRVSPEWYNTVKDGLLCK